MAFGRRARRSVTSALLDSPSRHWNLRSAVDVRGGHSSAAAFDECKHSSSAPICELFVMNDWCGSECRIAITLRDSPLAELLPVQPKCLRAT